jgi:hypothetical protein
VHVEGRNQDLLLIVLSLSTCNPLICLLVDLDPKRMWDNQNDKNGAVVILFGCR